MTKEKREHPKEKSRLHSRNKHRERYDFKQLTAKYPELENFVVLNKYNDKTINFSDQEAVKALNKALLINHYNITFWDIPNGYLCPPIPGRADYIHNIADLLQASNYGKMPTGDKIKCLDIGMGANCIYPIIGNAEYEWSFVGTDIDEIAIKNASQIVESNPQLKNRIELRLQHNKKQIFNGIIQENEKYDLTICNPPFHASMADAQSGNLRKLRNLNKKKITKPSLNFGGQSNEIWYEGGERSFVKTMINESKNFSKTCFWYSTLISKQTNLKYTYNLLKEAKAYSIKTIPMGQGNKSSRIVAWTFLNKTEQKKWAETKWK